jgi:hypothetical protein
MVTRKTKAKGRWLVDSLHPTLRDETAKDGAPVLLWLIDAKARNRSPSGRRAIMTTLMQDVHYAPRLAITTTAAWAAELEITATTACSPPTDGIKED